MKLEMIFDKTKFLTQKKYKTHKIMYTILMFFCIYYYL